MCSVLNASEILICITFGQGTKVLLTSRLIRNGNPSSLPLAKINSASPLAYERP
jgi:hypothetical protein